MKTVLLILLLILVGGCASSKKVKTTPKYSTQPDSGLSTSWSQTSW